MKYMSEFIWYKIGRQTCDKTSNSVLSKSRQMVWECYIDAFDFGDSCYEPLAEFFDII